MTTLELSGTVQNGEGDANYWINKSLHGTFTTLRFVKSDHSAPRAILKRKMPKIETQG